MEETGNQYPEAFESPDHSEWEDEPWDECMPSPGFITDFVHHSRGIETTTGFAIWTALFVLSSFAGKQTYLNWFPRNLDMNLYVILCAPPRICVKGTVAGMGAKLLKEHTTKMDNKLVARAHEQNIVRNKATPEALVDAMKPKKIFPKTADGTKGKPISLGSRVTIIATELETFLGKQTYNEGMIGLLTNLFDGEEDWEDRTKKRGKFALKDVYATFLGCTTPESLADSVPYSAFGGGFIGRVITVLEEKATRIYPFPKLIKGAPNLDDMLVRSAWVSCKGPGGYTLDPDAVAVYEEWYVKFKQNLEDYENDTKIIARLDNNLLKLSVLIRMSRYKPGYDVSLQDLLEAKKILDKTYSVSHKALQFVGAPRVLRLARQAEAKIRVNGTRTRRQMLTAYRWTTQECQQAMEQLKQEGKIDIMMDGRSRSRAGTSSKEEYIWVEPGRKNERKKKSKKAVPRTGSEDSS